MVISVVTSQVLYNVKGPETNHEPIETHQEPIGNWPESWSSDAIITVYTLQYVLKWKQLKPVGVLI